MDRRLLLLIAIFVLGSAGFFAYRMLYYKAEGVQYTIKPREHITVGDSIAYSDVTPGASRWKWNFGDGEFSADQSGHHTYLTSGTFPVTLTVYGSFGSQTKMDTVSVVAGNIVAKVEGPSIAGPAETKAGVPASWGSSVTAEKYEWKVMGEAPQKTAMATYSFKTPGTKTLVLTTKNPDHEIRRDINVVAAEVIAKPVTTAQAPVQQKPMQMPPANKPKPAQQQKPKGGNVLEDMDDGVEIKK